MSKTRIELVYRALKNLGALPQGMTPNTEEYNAVNDLVDCVVEDLIARNIAFIEDVDAIEEKFFMPLGHVLAGACLPEFGLVDDAALVAKAQKAEMDLKTISSYGPTYAAIEMQAF